jgi:hypothetical protein
MPDAVISAGQQDNCDEDRVHYLLTSNSPPVLSEIPTLQKIISALQARHIDVKRQIVTFEAILNSLRRQERVMQMELTACKAIVSLLRRLPNEILALIFEKYTFMEPPDWYSHPPSRRPNLRIINGPWILRNVCHRWREVAESTPMLWSQVTLGFTSTLGNGRSLPPAADSDFEETLNCLRKGLQFSSHTNLAIDMLYWSESQSLSAANFYQCTFNALLYLPTIAARISTNSFLMRVSSPLYTLSAQPVFVLQPWRNFTCTQPALLQTGT